MNDKFGTSRPLRMQIVFNKKVIKFQDHTDSREWLAKAEQRKKKSREIKGNDMALERFN